MRVYWAFLLVCATSILGAPKSNDRIVGGSLAVISQYPFIASLLYSSNLVSYYQACGGIILSKTAILTAAHCVSGDPVARWRLRVGSTNSNSGGYTYTFRQFIVHAGYQSSKLDNDIAVLKTEFSIIFKNDAVGQATIAGGSYSLPDNEPVWAVGWGATTSGGIGSEQLRHVQIWTVNQATCRARYAELGHTVTENMLCSGMLDVGGRDQCQGDSGGPLIHNNVIVGIYSWGHQCGLARYPGVNTRVSRFALWIQMATVQETNFETV